MKANQIPMYLTIKMDLIEKINHADFDKNLPLCTEKSLCTQYQVSRITAKRAIDELEKDGLIYRKRGVGSFVVKDLKTAADLIPAPKSLDAPYKTMALMIPFSIYKGGIFAAIDVFSNTLAAANIYLTLRVYSPGVIEEAEIITALYHNQADGIIYYPSTSHLPTEALDLYYHDQKPVIILDKPHSMERYSSVSCDNLQGSYLLTTHILAYGHKRTCYLTANPYEEISSIKLRYDGYVKAIKDFNPKLKPSIYQIEPAGHLDFPLLTHIVNTLHQQGVTAFLCENDELAFHIYMCCRSLGLRITEDVSICGFDNIEWATTAGAQLTTAAQDFVRIGTTVADIVLQASYQPIHKTIPVKLVPRTSTGIVPEKGN